MERIPGIAIPDGYVSAGPLFDAPPDAQRRVQAEYVDRLAEVHLLDWDAAGLGFLTPADARGLVHDVARLDDYLAWATDGDIPSVHRDALDWLRAGRPDPEPPLSLCWGDPRIGNVLYGPDWSQRALLDWEIASIGPAEMDVAWFLELHDTAAVGGDLPGFAPSVEMRDRWSARVGREVQAYGWFVVFSLLRAEAIYQRIRTMLLASGLDEPWLRAATPGELRIASLVR
jgi:aminoglycoside phosphotransferase (APT) family kinase protein